MVFGLAVLMQHVASAELPAPMPEFMSQDQLVKWRESQKGATAAQEGTRKAEEHQFYTGKPYDKDQEAYLFKYRSYDPELNRWTSQDPSGFPDGANNQVYSSAPNSTFDFSGLWTVKLTSPATFRDSKPGSDSGILTSWDYTLGQSVIASSSSIGAIASSTALQYVNFGGGPIDRNSAVGFVSSVGISVTSDGYLLASLPAGNADTDNRATAGVSLTGTGFDGTARRGTITVELISAYQGSVSYSASVGGLTYTPVPGSSKLQNTVSFTYEVLE